MSQHTQKTRPSNFEKTGFAVVLDTKSLAYDVYAVVRDKIVQTSTSQVLQLSSAYHPTCLVLTKAFAKKACSLRGNTLRCIVDNETSLLQTEVVYVLEWKLKL